MVNTQSYLPSQNLTFSDDVEQHTSSRKRRRTAPNLSKRFPYQTADTTGLSNMDEPLELAPKKASPYLICAYMYLVLMICKSEKKVLISASRSRATESCVRL